MELDDLILVSVDDHVIEPPDLFTNHRRAAGHDVSVMAGEERRKLPDQTLAAHRERAEHTLAASQG